MPETDYQYDVFFSYSSDPLNAYWIGKVVERLKFWLTQELGAERPARIFFDREGIRVGDRWPDAIRDALKTSKCMVGVWSPSYFQSQWCVSEWQSFLARERLLASTQPCRLIAPIKFHDGEHFPQEARDVQWEDFSNYTATESAFWATQPAVEFGRVLQRFAASVASLVRNAPDFQPDWPAVEAQPVAPPTKALRRL